MDPGVWTQVLRSVLTNPCVCVNVTGMAEANSLDQKPARGPSRGTARSPGAASSSVLWKRTRGLGVCFLRLWDFPALLLSPGVRHLHAALPPHVLSFKATGKKMGCAFTWAKTTSPL